MAPIKFEEDMRNTFEKRSIQPSKNAWNILASNLDAQEKKTNKRPFWWFGMAASFIGIILIATLFFKNDVEVITPIIIVDTPTIIEASSIQTIEQEAKSDAVILIAEEDVASEPKATEIASTTVVEKPREVEKTTILEKPIIEEELVAVQTEEETPVLTEEEQKIEEVVAQIIELKSQNESVTNAEIDALLFKAQNEINMKNRADVETISVSAYTLLMDVEQELDPSFRNKVFDLLKENYNSVKNTIAQRND